MPFPPPGLEPSSHGLQTDALTPMAMPAHINDCEKTKDRSKLPFHDEVKKHWTRN